VHSRDQLKSIADSFNEMTLSLKQAIDERAEKERMQVQLNMARKIQTALLPDETVDFKGLEIASVNLSAYEVSGDYFDYFQVRDNKFVFIIADVAGKGISAAFYMSQLKGLVLALSNVCESPREFLLNLNTLLWKTLDRKVFITMAYGIVDVNMKKFYVANAGHPPCLMVRKGEHVVRNIKPGGIVLGADSGEKFEKFLEVMELDLVEEDVIVFYTDGFTEARDQDGNLFGEARLNGLILEQSGASPNQIKSELVSSIEHFTDGKPAGDDCSLIIVKFKGLMN
jgi:serine phosphatase RsbU (regulator of sigma subunit)